MTQQEVNAMLNANGIKRGGSWYVDVITILDIMGSKKDSKQVAFKCICINCEYL